MYYEGESESSGFADGLNVKLEKTRKSRDRGLQTEDVTCKNSVWHMLQIPTKSEDSQDADPKRTQEKESDGQLSDRSQ